MTTSALQCTRKADWKKTGVPPDGFTIAPPDGKWGWVMLFGCCLCGLTGMVNNIVFGVTMKEVTYALTTNLATLSWALSISSGGGCLMGPIVTIIINNYSCRRSVIIGGLMCSLGLILSTFVDRVEFMMVTFGVITGIGKRLMFAPLLTCLSVYFKKYLGIAMGLLTASYAASKFIMTPIIQLTLENYGWRGTFLIMGGFMLHVCLGASFLQPVKWHSVLVPIHSDDKNVTEVSNDVPNSTQNSCQSQPIHVLTNGPQTNGPQINSIKNNPCISVYGKADLPTEESCKQLLDTSQTNGNGVITNLRKCKCEERRFSEMSINLASSYDIFSAFPQETTKSLKTATSHDCFSSCKKLIFESIDCSLLKERLFYLVCITQALSTATNIYVTIFVFHFGTEVGLSPMQAAGLESARSLGEITGRLAGPILLIVLKLPTRLTYLSCVFLHGISLFALTNLETFSSLYGVGVLCGLLLGSAVGLHGLLTVEQMGVKRLASVLGLCALFQGFFLIVVGPFLGWIRDITGQYTYCLIFLSVLQLIIAIIWLLKPCIVKTVNGNNNNETKK